MKKKSRRRKGEAPFIAGKEKRTVKSGGRRSLKNRDGGEKRSRITGKRKRGKSLKRHRNTGKGKRRLMALGRKGQ